VSDGGGVRRCWPQVVTAGKTGAPCQAGDRIKALQGIGNELAKHLPNLGTALIDRGAFVPPPSGLSPVLLPTHQRSPVGVRACVWVYECGSGP
jgi:hypothetical protein